MVVAMYILEVLRGICTLRFLGTWNQDESTQGGESGGKETRFLESKDTVLMEVHVCNVSVRNTRRIYTRCMSGCAVGSVC